MTNHHETTGNFKVEVTPLTPDDIVQLEPIIRQHVRGMDDDIVDEEEVTAILGYMSGGLDSQLRQRNYFVAKDQEGKVLGCVGLTSPESALVEIYAVPHYCSGELVNLFVDTNAQGKGVGKQLFNALCTLAREKGYQQILLDSGPRYQKSWPFYDKICDQSAGVIADKYGEGYHAKTWIKYL